MVSQRSLLSAPRLLTILLASFTVLSSVNRATAQDDSDYSSDDSTTINGITISEADQAPECMYKCPALEKYGMGTELPQCITEELKDPKYSKYAEIIKSGDSYDIDEEAQQDITEIMSCVCTDVDFVKELADCVFNEPCGNNNTAIYEAINIGYKLCGVMYNVTYPAPTEVVKMLNISVPSGVIVPTTITGVPQATTWPGKTVTAAPSATISSSNPSSTATSSSSNSNSTIVAANTNAAMKSSPSYYLVFLAFFAFLAVSVSAQSNGTNPITSTITSTPTTTAIANGTLTYTSTVSVASGVSNGTLTTTSRTNGTSTTASSTRTTTTAGTSSTTASRSPDASASSTAVPGSAIRNGASFGLVAAGAVAAAFLF